MRAFHADTPELTLPAGHRYPMSKHRMLIDAVRSQIPSIEVIAASPASDGELALAHEPSWISAVGTGTTSAAQQREIGFPWSEAMVLRARRSVGATIQAARTAYIHRQGVSCNLAGGTHHAQADKGSGYCVFNDVAVAARLMQAESHRLYRRLARVWVIDLDVHQGNGTAAIFRDDPTVFTMSIHARNNFPFRKVASDLDVELDDDCGDDEYLAALGRALAVAWECQIGHPPDLAFYLAGADPHVEDRLGRLSLTVDGLARRDLRVFEWLEQMRVPVAVVMAGGYNRDPAVTVEIHRNTLELARLFWQRWSSRAR